MNKKVNFGKPYQIMFAIGSIQGLLIIIWWLWELSILFFDFPSLISEEIPPLWAHIILMIYTFFPIYIFGFLMTAYPVWLQSKPISINEVFPISIILVLGILITNIGLSSSKFIFLLGISFFAIAWLSSIRLLFGIFKNAKKKKKIHFFITTFFLVIGLLMLSINAFGIYFNDIRLINFGKSGGIWWFLFPIFISISHRLIPFFTSVVIKNYKLYRPSLILSLILICIFIHGLLEILELNTFLWICDLPIAIITLRQSWKWIKNDILPIRILFMLHISYFWVCISFFLFSIQSLFLMNDKIFLLSGPLHGITIGFFSSMLFAMVTRVSLGHSGRKIHANNFIWWLFLIIQLATILRLIADTLVSYEASILLFIISGSFWFFSFSGWIKEFFPMYLNDLKKNEK